MIEVMNSPDNKRSLFIFCGGESRRMERDKAQLRIGDETFLEYLVRRSETGKRFSDISLLSGGRTYELGLKTYADTHPGCGPLGGLLSAMTVSKSLTFATAAVDSPMISGRLLKVLASYVLTDELDAAIVRSPTSIYPLTGIYHTRSGKLLKKRLLEGNYKVMDFIRSIRVEIIPCEEDEIRNINLPEDYLGFIGGKRG